MRDAPSSSSPALFILYVADQQRSRDFYRLALGLEPVLDVPGMTQFRLGSAAMLGLMPETGIARIIGNVPDPASGNGIPRAELYLIVDDPAGAIQRSINAGGELLSELQPRNWGDNAGYVRDPDGHVLAFACRRES